MRESVVTVVVILAAISADAQTQNRAASSVKASPPSSSAPLRTADGHPDLQGEWTYDTLTPLERPKQFAGKAFFDASEQAAFEAAALGDFLARLGDENLKTSGDIGFAGRGKLLPDRRTALIIDPPNGTLPPLLPTAQHRLNDYLERQRQHVADGPEDFGISERCIWWRSPPMFPLPSDAHLRIVQTPDYVAIQLETFGEARVVPLNGRLHLPSSIRQWKGDSRGSWEGDTLVVEATTFRSEGPTNLGDPLRASDESLRVVERFSIVDADTILYRFTVDDPTAYASAWTAEWPFRRATTPMFEYACHEGNYSLRNSLLGARAVERKKAAGPH
jgi:hypothetical protein